ncbi:OX-2 membrane glycoprotein-like isoform X2 [Xiphias gladius]|uniref:OX-2 membrane glycoprotein-like isoform X2 n=1 Tax=Xiphias gladius TaxID=8245 RepID=UPI001A981BEC|nr:OX-2 membrane glycoprotein-like isoform X2 [Xiphias gladius]
MEIQQLTTAGRRTTGAQWQTRQVRLHRAGVLQVTWQRLFKDESVDNLATYSKRFGQQVNEPYRGKLSFTEASLSSTSISLRNVSWQDESCYICSFNVYPDGSRRRQTCLTVQGISAVNTAYVPGSGRAGEDTEAVFSCSATGKPAPTVEWDISPGATQPDLPQTATVMNGDHTFTSSHNITLQVPPDWAGHVDCVLNRGLRGQRWERIPFSLGAGHPEKDREDDDGKGQRRSGFALVIPVLLFLSCVTVAAAIMKRKRLKDNRRNENVL